MVYKITGNWKQGFAYDIHTLSSEFIGTDEYGRDKYDTIRSEMGELVYQLKYKNDSSAAKKIVALLRNIKGYETMDAVIPIPPSNKNREHQPVFEIATEFGKMFNILVYLDFFEKTGNPQELKSITDPTERKKALENSIHIANIKSIVGKDILLIDDLYRSGSTLSVATELLYHEAKVKNVFALTMTKTRSNR